MLRHFLCSVVAQGPGLVIPGREYIHNEYNKDNKRSPCECHQSLLDRALSIVEHLEPDVVVYIHDDVTIHDPDWLSKLLFLFDNPKCVAAGLGGATSLGRPNLYKQPYRIENMARGGYASNQTDAEVHGERFTGNRRVAVLDAFTLAVRVSFLHSVGGWPIHNLTHHCLDLWLGCVAARHNKEVWMTGASCTHHGGGSSVKTTYEKASWLQGGSRESDHQIPHRWLFDSFRDVLPIQV